MNLKSKFYFTFGSSHEDSKGESLRMSYVVIEAPDEGTAREEMFAARGSKWSFCYGADEFRGQPEEYNLTERSLESVTIETAVKR